MSTSSPEQTQSAGRILGAHADAGDVFLLTGDLGAGKTCLTQGILWGLGGDEYARSPTFVLICEYYARLTMYHMDLYRLDSIDEVVDLGLDDYFLGDGVCVVEWADKGAGAYIGEHVNVVIEDTGDNCRRLTIGADSARYSEMLGALQQEFLSPEGAAQPQPANSEAE
ncbi:MAG: tRNA (adenosine(37)-N6)-threonylcarbamoyltransferase complex ATPase subunit type 1 TsaE [Chloroflexi bacterium]|nr:tRNA (adenosine(37)-N6)-threonylcarbamoyltransferase complex ATPase subunit type 1 TsaE [Chloroflexota bacterium]